MFESFLWTQFRIGDQPIIDLRLVRQRQHSPLPPPQIDRRVDRDSIDPSIKGTIFAKRRQLAECLEERVLQNIVGIRRVSKHSRDAVEQSVLVLHHQRSKSLRITVQDGLNNLTIVGVHIVAVHYLDPEAAPKVPKLRLLAFAAEILPLAGVTTLFIANFCVNSQTIS